VDYDDAVNKVAWNLTTRKIHKYLGGALDTRVDTFDAAMVLGILFPQNAEHAQEDLEREIEALVPAALKGIK
jgi:hypothetical protein